MRTRLLHPTKNCYAAIAISLLLQACTGEPLENNSSMTNSSTLNYTSSSSAIPFSSSVNSTSSNNNEETVDDPLANAKCGPEPSGTLTIFGLPKLITDDFDAQCKKIVLELPEHLDFVVNEEQLNSFEAQLFETLVNEENLDPADALGVINELFHMDYAAGLRALGTEGEIPAFVIHGGTLRNAFIDNTNDGIHVDGDATLINVTWLDMDEITLLERGPDSSATLINSGLQSDVIACGIDGSPCLDFGGPINSRQRCDSSVGEETNQGYFKLADTPYGRIDFPGFDLTGLAEPRGELSIEYANGSDETIVMQNGRRAVYLEPTGSWTTLRTIKLSYFDLEAPVSLVAKKSIGPIIGNLEFQLNSSCSKLDPDCDISDMPLNSCPQTLENLPTEEPAAPVAKMILSVFDPTDGLYQGSLSGIGASPNLRYFSAAQSLDPNHDRLTHHWNFNNGATAEGQETSHRFEPGYHVATLTVTDPSGLTDKTAKTFAVYDDEKIEGNTLPEAIISDFQTRFLTSRGPFSITGAESTDQDGDLLDFTWFNHSNFDVVRTPNLELNFTEALNTKLTLAVADGRGGFDTTNVTLEVRDVPEHECSIQYRLYSPIDILRGVIYNNSAEPKEQWEISFEFEKDVTIGQSTNLIRSSKSPYSFTSEKPIPPYGWMAFDIQVEGAYLFKENGIKPISDVNCVYSDKL